MARKKSEKPAGKVANHEYVFGLDIGTRNVVGTVGYMEDEIFHVIAQSTREHTSRSMLDGQIHDIEKVSKVIIEVKNDLEEKIGFKLEKVCIAAAGRVLQTVDTTVEHVYEEESIVTGEDLYALDLSGVDQAHKELTHNDDRYKFYCVGYTVMRYYLNDEEFKSLEGHKANRIKEDMIVTFLPEDVVDGLYSAVERAGMYVANLTLEPIAAINVAIPETYRMLNISLVDVGAGTSDICITKDSAIVAYGMIPYAGDEITEVLVKEYLCDFANAENIKKQAALGGNCEFEDIMGLTHTVSSEDVWKVCEPVVEKITTAISEKIKELNGGTSVAAVFIVGGGGKAHDFSKMIAQKLDIPPERVALRGEDVMKMVEFKEKGITKDSLLVTPIGICLNYFQQRNSFIMVRFNGKIVKMYDNGYLKVVDAALAGGLTTEEIFPRRGKELHFTVNGVKRMVRGTGGESAKVFMNGREVGLNETLLPNSEITIELSTQGEDAVLHISDLTEFNDAYVDFIVNGQRVHAPKYVEVNGQLATAEYAICDGDIIETRAYYTVGQLTEFMDVLIDDNYDLVVNNKSASLDTLLYENFTVEWTVSEGFLEDKINNILAKQEAKEKGITLPLDEIKSDGEPIEIIEPFDINVTVNDTPITLTGKNEYIFIDIYNYYEFSADRKKASGKRVVTKINGNPCTFSDPIHDGDKIDLYWEDRK